MARAVIITDGVVVNVIEVADDVAPPEIPGLVIPSDIAVPQIGWAYDATAKTFTAPEPTLAEVQATATASLTSAAKAKLLGGFSSSALGSPFSYKSDAASLTDLATSTLAAASAPAGWTTQIASADTTGVYALRPHTAIQAQEVQRDYTSARDATNVALQNALAAVNGATTTAAVRAVTLG